MRHPGAEWLPSPNFSRRREPVRFITCHQTDGQPDVYRAAESHCDPKNQKSAHFFVGRAGEVLQLVDTDDCAWHDSGRNGESIGIEFVARQPGEFDDRWHKLSGGTKQALGARSTDDRDPGLPLTEPQLAAGAKLVAALLRHHGLLLEAVRPHCSSPTTTHTKCGADKSAGGIWDWTDFRRRIDEALTALATEPAQG